MPAAPTGLRLVCTLGGSVAHSDSLLLYAYRRPRPEEDTKFFCGLPMRRIGQGLGRWASQSSQPTLLDLGPGRSRSRYFPCRAILEPVFNCSLGMGFAEWSSRDVRSRAES